MNCDDRWKTPDIDGSCGHSYAPSRKVAGVFHNCMECLKGHLVVAAGLLAGSIALIGFGMDNSGSCGFEMQHFCTGASLGVCSNLMGAKLLVAMLVLALSGANSGLASLCAAYCMSSASAASAAHRHHTNSQAGPASTSQNIHVNHKGVECAECPPTSGNSLKQKADCASLDQIQILKEDSFNLDAPSGITQFAAADTPVRAVGLTWDDERSFVFAAPRTTRSFPSPPLPLRI